MKLEFALIWFALLLGAIAVDEVSAGHGDSSKSPEPPTSTTAPLSDDEKDYMLTFMSHGLDITIDNLFNYTWKQVPKLKPIFNYTKGTNENFANVELHVTFPSKEIDIYMHEPDLNPLLNATIAVLYPGNYSYQLYHSSYYGRVSADTFLTITKYQSTLASEMKEELFTKEFLADAKELVNSKNYLGFIAKYGTYYFKTAIFGGMIRIQTHATNKFVRDASKSGFETYLELQLNQTITIVAPLPYDFFYHCYSENSTFGGDKTANISEPGGVTKWVTSFLYPTEIAPVIFEVEPIWKLMENTFVLPVDANATEIINELSAAILNEESKFKVKSYMEAMDVVRKNPYGKSLGGSFDAQFLYSYFEGKLNETDVTLDDEFYDNAWAAEHNAQAILNRRGWFEKPYPPYPSTLAPTTEPTKPSNATEAAATTEATTKKA